MLIRMLGMAGRKRSVDLLSLMVNGVRSITRASAMGAGRAAVLQQALALRPAGQKAGRTMDDGRSRQCADEALQRKEEGVAMPAAALVSNTNASAFLLGKSAGSRNPADEREHQQRPRRRAEGRR